MGVEFFFISDEKTQNTKTPTFQQKNKKKKKQIAFYFSSTEK